MKLKIKNETLDFASRVGVVFLFVAFLTGLGFWLSVNSPCGDVAYGAECPTGSTNTFSQDVGIQAGTVNTITITGTPTADRTFTLPDETGTAVIIDANGETDINDTDNASMTQGVTIAQGANDDEILTLKSSDVAHGLTGETETDSYAFFEKRVDTAGGLQITGLEDTTNPIGGALVLHGVTSAGETTKSTSGHGTVIIAGGDASGTNWSDLDADENILSIAKGENSSTDTVAIFDADGDAWLNGVVNSDNTGVDATFYADLNTALTTIGASTRTTLTISDTQTVNTDTVTPNITLKFVGAGEISVNAAQVLTVQSEIIAEHQIFTGSGTVNMIGIKNRFIDARWFGMIPASVPDAAGNVTALQAAIDSSRNPGLTDSGPCVRVPNSVWYLNDTINMNLDGQCVIGDTMFGRGRPDISNVSGTALIFLQTGAEEGFHLNGCDRCSIQNMEIEFFDAKATQTGHGIYVQDSPFARPVVQNVSIYQAGGDCIRLDGSWITVISRVSTYACGGYGIHLISSSQTVIRDSEIDVNDVGGIAINASGGIVIQGNEISGNPKGILWLGSTGNTQAHISGNFLENATVFDIELPDSTSGTKGVVIEGNNFDSGSATNILLGNNNKDCYIGTNITVGGTYIRGRAVDAGTETNCVMYAINEALATDFDISVDASDVVGADDDTHWGNVYTVTFISPRGAGVYTRGIAGFASSDNEWQRTYTPNMKSVLLTSGTTISWRDEIDGAALVLLNHSAPTTITDIDDDNNIESMITFLCLNGNATIADGAGMILAGGANFACNATDTLQLLSRNGTWYEVSRSVN